MCNALVPQQQRRERIKAVHVADSTLQSSTFKPRRSLSYTLQRNPSTGISTEYLHCKFPYMINVHYPGESLDHVITDQGASHLTFHAHSILDTASTV